MYYNGKKGYRTTVFLKDVHTVLWNKYVANEDEQIAKELQTFLSNIKKAAYYGVESLSNDIDKELFQELLDEIGNQLSTQQHFSKTKGVDGIFRRQGRNSYKQGDFFERELTAVVQAVAMKAGNIQIPNSEIRTGQVVGTTTLNDDLLNAIDDFIEKGLSEQDAFKSATKSLGIDYKKLVQIKTDVQGVHIDIDASTNETFQKWQKLLSQATFTAKSYSGSHRDKNGDIKDLNLLYPNIHLGSSDPYRAIYGVLTSIGNDTKTAESAYYAGRELIKKGNQKVINHMYHIKYIYELTGAGTKIRNGIYNEAKFLVYNDPSSDYIYVRSASSILRDVLGEGDFSGNPLGGINISKSSFH